MFLVCLFTFRNQKVPVISSLITVAQLVKAYKYFINCTLDFFLSYNYTISGDLSNEFPSLIVRASSRDYHLRTFVRNLYANPTRTFTNTISLITSWVLTCIISIWHHFRSRFFCRNLATKDCMAREVMSLRNVLDARVIFI